MDAKTLEEVIYEDKRAWFENARNKVPMGGQYMNARRSEFKQVVEGTGELIEKEDLEICPQLYAAVDESRASNPRRERLLQWLKSILKCPNQSEIVGLYGLPVPGSPC